MKDRARAFGAVWRPDCEADPRGTRRCENDTAGSVGANSKEMLVRLANGSLRRAEIHWYEAHGVGKRGLKIKRFLD